MEFGKRLLPQVVDNYARTEPDRVYASITRSAADLSAGFQDVTMAKLAAIVNSLSFWLEDTLGIGSLNTIGYIGPADIRYAALFLAAVKCRYKMLFISPRNQVPQNQSLLMKSDCSVLLYAEELAQPAAQLQENLSHLVIKNVLSLEKLLETPEDNNHYPFDKSFDEVQNEPCLILHSSGSTGNPKLVTLTHGSIAVIDNDRNIPVPKGRNHQNAAQFNFEGGGRFYSCFPPYHLAGVYSYISLPIYSNSATVVFGPAQLPPSGYLLSGILKLQHIRACYVPPSIVEQWSAEPAALEQAKQLDFVLFSGGPLSPHIGNKLTQVTNLCQVYGSLETGLVQTLVPQPGEWSYMEFNPFEEADMQPIGDGAFEMVLHQDPKFAAHRPLWHNFPNVKTWRTGDLFIPHASKPGLWRFHSRIDDLIVFSSSYKLRPLEMETIVQGDPLLSGALIVGQGKPEPLLIVEPKGNEYDGSPEALIDRIWPSIKDSNATAATYAQISRSKVLVALPEKPFIRAPKGTIVRKLTVQAYAKEIEAAYEDDKTHAEPNRAAVPHVDGFILPGLKLYVRKHFQAYLSGVSLSDSDNIFLRGLDSISAGELTRGLQMGLASRMTPTPVSLRMIYKYPTVEGLALAILDAMLGRHIPDLSFNRDVKSMERAVVELTENLPPATALPPVISEGLHVVLIGPRGSLGPNIIRELMLNPRVATLYCLNRGEDGRERMRAVFNDRHVPCNVDDSRLCFMPITLGKLRLGLSDVHYDELSRKAHIIIHNAWKVDFSWTLDSYKAEHLQSIRELVDFSAFSLLKPRIVLVSSISSVEEWPSIYSTPVNEKALESFDVSSTLGYGQSKHVAERILQTASAVSGIPITILRLGQIAGPTTVTGGKWSMDEWVPSLATISKALKMIPTDLPPIDWMPVDVMARVICELALPQGEDKTSGSLEEVAESIGSLRVFNVVNPHLAEWATFVGALHRRVGKTAQLVTMREWVDYLMRASPESMSREEALCLKTTPFFQHLDEMARRGVPLQPKLETSGAVAASRAMAEMRAIDEALMDLWCQQW